eukprot:m.211849 g.211849  ORF g.211849 m.211849 type:complete len:241 (-) comp25506_c0_seq16:398-1120(-)
MSGRPHSHNHTILALSPHSVLPHWRVMSVSWDALAPGESILQYAARRRHVHPLGGLGIPLFTRDGDGLHPRQLVELCGAEGSGKSEILLGAIAACVTPAAFGGAGAEAVILDADRKFSLLRLITLIEDRVKRASDPETVVRQCLSRVEVASIDSAFQLGATLLCLAETLTARPAVQLVVVDSIGAHHWVDRATSGTEHGQVSASSVVLAIGNTDLANLDNSPFRTVHSPRRAVRLRILIL